MSVANTDPNRHGVIDTNGDGHRHNHSHSYSNAYRNSYSHRYGYCDVYTDTKANAHCAA